MLNNLMWIIKFKVNIRKKDTQMSQNYNVFSPDILSVDSDSDLEVNEETKSRDIQDMPVL